MLTDPEGRGRRRYIRLLEEDGGHVRYVKDESGLPFFTAVASIDDPDELEIIRRNWFRLSPETRAELQIVESETTLKDEPEEIKAATRSTMAAGMFNLPAVVWVNKPKTTSDDDSDD